MGMMRYLIIPFFLLLFPSIAEAQESDERRSIRFLAGYVHGGQLQIHSSKIEHYRGVQPVGAGLDLAWKFVSPDAYSLCRCYPSLGISLNYWDFGHSSLGNGVSALFYVEPVLFSPFDVDVSLKTGLGISYLDNPHDEIHNPGNLVYSTSVSFPLMGGVSLYHALSDDWSVGISAMFQHISNGGTNQPNLGINYTTLGIGISRKLDAQSLPAARSVEPFDPATAKSAVSLAFLSGLKEPENSESKAFVGGLSAEYHSQFARINGWSVGLMGEWDGSREGTSLSKLGRLSAVAGHHFLLGRFDFGQTAGLYLLQGHTTHSPWFQYYTLDFELNSLFGVGVGLKAHGKVAEFLGARMSLTL
jgi:hypothetical protein